MERELSDLNKTPGIIGSFVVGEDGIMIASDFMTEENVDIMGALASSIINSAGKVVQKLNQGKINAFFLETDKNKIFFQQTKTGFLVAVTTIDANIGLIRVEMKLAAQKLDDSMQ